MLKLNPEERLFIDGALVAAEHGQTYDVINPASEEVVGVMGSPMGGPARRFVCKEAAGVVVAITPWNAPVQTNLQKCVPALAAGCTVVLKAAHDTPWSATMLGRVAGRCPDLPPGALNSGIPYASLQSVFNIGFECVQFTRPQFTGSVNRCRLWLSQVLADRFAIASRQFADRVDAQSLPLEFFNLLHVFSP
jgi:hypothetical protein